MNIKQLIQNASFQGDKAALDIYNKILNVSKEQNLSIQESINYLLTIEKSHFIINLLKTCKAVLKEVPIVKSVQSKQVPKNLQIIQSLQQKIDKSTNIVQDQQQKQQLKINSTKRTKHQKIYNTSKIEENKEE